MTTTASRSHWRSLVATWIYQQLAMRRVLPLAVLTLWGCLLTLGLVIHPDTPRSYIHQSSTPFFTANGDGIDFYQFWVVGQAQERLHLDNIYSQQDRQQLADLGSGLLRSSSQRSKRLAGSVEFRQRTIETFSTPFLYATIHSFASNQYDRDYDYFLNICLAALMLSILAMGWLLCFSLAESLLFAAVVVLWCEPLTSDLRVGNVNQLQLAGLALYLLSRCRPESMPMDVLGGLVLGLLVAFKPTLGVIPILLALAWIIDHRWRTLWRQGIAAVIAMGAAFVVGCRFLNSWSAWSNWANALSDMEKVSDISVENWNISLIQVILEATRGIAGGGVTLDLILLTLLLVLASVALHLTRPGTPSVVNFQQVWFERDFLVTALGGAVSILALRLVWIHYYILLIPLLLYVLRPGAWIRPNATVRSQPRLLLAVAGPVLALLALVTVFGRPFVFLADPDPSTTVSLYIGGAWGLLIMGLAGLWLPSTAPRKR
jgi:hypothetical protein